MQLKSKMDELLENKQLKILLNLAHVTYMDHGGLGEITRSYTSTRNAGGALKLLNARKRITDLLTITKLITVFELYDDEAAAITSFVPAEQSNEGAD